VSTPIPLDDRRVASPDPATLRAILAALNRHALAERFPAWRPHASPKPGARR
jgi:hypothetical protein